MLVSNVSAVKKKSISHTKRVLTGRQRVGKTRELMAYFDKELKPKKCSVSYQKAIRGRTYLVRSHIPLVKGSRFTHNRKKVSVKVVQR